MQKLLNDPEDFVDEMLEGFVLANAGRLRLADESQRAVIRGGTDFQGRVTIATGGGSGHLPLFADYVAPGFVDGCCVGNLFAAPSSDEMLAVTQAINGGRGVLYLYGNYGGDRLNFDLAAELAEAEGIPIRSVRCADDVASGPPDNAARRRGVAGIYFGYRIAGACAASGADLDEVHRVAQHAVDCTRSIGVALSGTTLPTVGHPNFEVPVGEMEIGMGIHGEPGVRRGPLLSADAIVDDMLERLLTDFEHPTGCKFAVLINGLGATPLEELYILYRRVHHNLVGGGHSIHRAFVGEYATSLEMVGASISLLKLDDDLIRYLDAAPETSGVSK
jgi:dihydroxyacetone kinase-like protein